METVSNILQKSLLPNERILGEFLGKSSLVKPPKLTAGALGVTDRAVLMSGLELGWLRSSVRSVRIEAADILDVGVTETEKDFTSAFVAQQNRRIAGTPDAWRSPYWSTVVVSTATARYAFAFGSGKSDVDTSRALQLIAAARAFTSH